MLKMAASQIGLDDIMQPTATKMFFQYVNILHSSLENSKLSSLLKIIPCKNWLTS